MPKVSVIVPVYKAEKYLNRCVDSLLTQTLDDIQIILVDDGSPDRSGEICDAYVCKPGGGGILVIHKENGGASSARNAGLDVATGEYIAFVDADDEISDPRAYEILYNKAKLNDVDTVFFGFLNQIGETDNFETLTSNHTPKDHLYQKAEFLPWIALQRPLNTSLILGCPFNKLHKRKLLEGLKFKTNFVIQEDIIFNYSTYEKAEKVLLTSFAPYKHYNTPGSLMRGGIKQKKALYDSLRLVDETKDFYQRNNLWNYKTYFYKFEVGWFYVWLIEVAKSGSPKDMIEMLRNAFRKRFFLYVRSPMVFLVFLLFELHCYSLIYPLYNAKNTLKNFGKDKKFVILHKIKLFYAKALCHYPSLQS